MAVSPVLVLATASLLCCFLRYGDMKYIIVRIPINSRYVFFSVFTTIGQLSNFC